MDDLMASIRKIIADDYGAGEATTERRDPAWADGSVDLSGSDSGQTDQAPADVDNDISAFVARSMREALAQQPDDQDQDLAEPLLSPATDDRDSGTDEQTRALEAAIMAGSVAHVEAERTAARDAAERRAASLEAAKRNMPKGEPDIDDGPLRRAQPPQPKEATGGELNLSPRERLRALASTGRRAQEMPAAEVGDSIAVPAPHTVHDNEAGEEHPLGADFEQRAAAYAQSATRPDSSDDGLTSTRTRHNVSTSFEQLSRTILTNNPRTVEDLVRDMVRPLLREWLDANLGHIVERQVRQEIDRMSSRGR